MMLDLTDFDINRMIKTTILTFEGTCSAKGLSFDARILNGVTAQSMIEVIRI